MLLLSAHGKLPLFHTAVVGKAVGRDTAQIHAGAPLLPCIVGWEAGRSSQLAMNIIIRQVIYKYSMKQGPELHKQQQILQQIY